MIPPPLRVPPEPPEEEEEEVEEDAPVLPPFPPVIRELVGLLETRPGTFFTACTSF